MKVTIGICAYNEESNIGGLLGFLLKEKFNFKLEKVIAVVGGSDQTIEITKGFMNRFKKLNMITEERRKGKASAINSILKNAIGDVIIFICGDNVPKRESINNLVKVFSNREVEAAYGRSIPEESKNTLFGYISHLICDLQHEAGKMKPKILGELCAIRNGIVNELPYNIINDDAYFTAVIRNLGHRIIYVPKAVTYMSGKSDLLSHLKRRRRIARGHIQLRKIGLNVSIRTKIILKLIVGYTRKDTQNILKILFAIVLEIIINVLASYDTLLGRTPYCWEK